MQRVLRGRSVYILLTLLVVMLMHFGRSADIGSWVPLDTPLTESHRTSAEWMGQEVSPATLKAAAETDPLLAVALFVLTIFTGCMIIGGVLLGLWGLATGRVWTLWQQRTRRPPAWRFSECWRIIVLMVLLGALLQFARVAIVILVPGWPLDTNLWVNVSMLTLQMMLLLTIFAFAVGKTHPALRAVGLGGLSTKKFSQAISIGVRGYVAIFPWLLLLLILVVELANAFQITPPVQPIQQMIFAEERPMVLGLTIFMTCLIGPVAEEVFFRGVLYGAMRRRTARWVAVFVSGALFSAVHTNLIGFVPILLLGCLLADLYERTGTLVSPIAIHILHNTYLLTLSLTFRWMV